MRNRRGAATSKGAVKLGRESEFPLQRPYLDLLLVRHQADDGSRAPGPAGATRPVHIARPRRPVGRNARHRGRRRRESPVRRRRWPPGRGSVPLAKAARALVRWCCDRSPWMGADRTPAAPSWRATRSARTLGPAEHEGLAVLRDELSGELHSIGTRHPPEVVRDVVHLRLFGIDLVARRVVLITPADRLYLFAHGRREQQDLAPLRRLVDQTAHGADETHVHHAVRLIEHNGANLPQVHVASLQPGPRVGPGRPRRYPRLGAVPGAEARSRRLRRARQPAWPREPMRLASTSRTCSASSRVGTRTSAAGQPGLGAGGVR